MQLHWAAPNTERLDVDRIWVGGGGAAMLCNPPSSPPLLLFWWLQIEKACLPALRELGFDEDHIIVF